MWHHGMGYSMGHWFSGIGFSGFFMNLLFIIAVIAVFARFFKGHDSVPKENRDTVDSLEILKQRLARGEIDEEEFSRIKKNL